MALLCLAIVGKENEPLYLCDVSENDTSQESEEGEDIFGFLDDFKSQNDSLRQEFMFHAAIDRMEEIMGRQPARRWRSPKAPASADSSWVGLLCQMEEARIYGYVTTTNIKFLGMIKDSHDDLVPTSREADLRALFSDIHDLYVKYTLNPFSKIGERIVSNQFDEGIKSCVAKFESKADPPKVETTSNADE